MRIRHSCLPLDNVKSNCAIVDLLRQNGGAVGRAQARNRCHKESVTSLKGYMVQSLQNGKAPEDWRTPGRYREARSRQQQANRPTERYAFLRLFTPFYASLGGARQNVDHIKELRECLWFDNGMGRAYKAIQRYTTLSSVFSKRASSAKVGNGIRRHLQASWNVLQG